MPSRPCLHCGRLVDRGSYCARHEPRRERNTPGRTGAAAFRAAVISQAGLRCQWVSVEGVRCSTTAGLEAHHRVPLAAGGSNQPENGLSLCRRHHRIVERLTNEARKAG